MNVANPSEAPIKQRDDIKSNGDPRLKPSPLIYAPVVSLLSSMPSYMCECLCDCMCACLRACFCACERVCVLVCVDFYAF